MFAERDEHYLPTERTNWDTHRWDGEEIFFLAKIHSNRECRMHQMPCTNSNNNNNKTNRVQHKLE